MNMTEIILRLITENRLYCCSAFHSHDSVTICYIVLSLCVYRCRFLYRTFTRVSLCVGYFTYYPNLNYLIA